MPPVNPEKLHEQAQALKAQIKEKGESLEGPERRALGKRLRRLQRKRRRLLARRAKAAPKAPASEAPKEG